MALAFPEIDPVAVAAGPFEIRWYALAYLAGFLIGWRYMIYLVRLDRAPALEREAVDDFLSWAILGVILGGRAGYVLFYNAGEYLADPLEIFRIWHGGMSFHGGAAGMIAAMLAFSARRGARFLRLADLVCCTVPVGIFFGRLANFVNGELFGRVTAAPWGMVFPGGGPEPRHPSQLYEAGLEGIALAVLMAVLAHRPGVRARPGVLSGVFLAGYAAARLFVENFREPDFQIGFVLPSVTMGQVLSVPMLIAGIYFMVAGLRKAAP